MENTDLINNKAVIRICGLAYILLIVQSFSIIYAAEPQFPDEFKVREYFSFFGSGGIDWQALNDPNNNPILVACIKGIADESLKPPGIHDVQKRLERLERGNLIKKIDGRYALTFPAVVGDKRDRLREYAEQAARQLVRPAEKMIAQIRLHLAGRDEMLYHVLWSVVMDGGPAWDAARAEMNKKIGAGDTSTDNKAWLLYPSHPFQAGTNSWNNSSGQLRVTWSHNTPSPNAIGGVISQYASQLIQAIEQDRAIESPEAKDALGKYGLVNEAGKARLYTIESDSEAAKSYAELGAEFGRQIMTQLDAKKVAEMLEVSPGVAFVIAYHEICWQLLQDLAEKKVLEVPPIVAKSGIEASVAYQLVSLTIIQSVKHPLPDTEISAEEAKTIEYFEKTKNEILQGRKFSNQSTPADALLTLISAYHHQDQNILEQIFPIVKQKQYERLSSPEVGAQMLAAVRKAIICRIEIENEPPKESDLCAIYSSESPDKTIDQVWSFAYVEGAWRFAGGTSATDNWRTQAKQAEALTRNILQSEAENTKATATNTLQQKANKIEGKWDAILAEFNQKYVMRFWRKPDGTLAGAATRNSPDDRPFDGVTFENGKLRFEEKVNQGVFEGTMKEDGLTIEGKWQKSGMITPCVLERIEDVEIEDKGRSDSGIVQGSEKQFRHFTKLVAFWRLDEADGNDVTDSSGNACEGKLVGNPQWRPAGGKVGGALEFDGDGDYVLIGNESAFDIAGPISIAAWIKVNSFDKRWQALVTKGDTAWRLQRTAEENTLAFHCTGITSITGQRPEGIEGKKNVNDGQWHHAVGVYDGVNVSLYIDGELDNSSKASGVIQTNDSAVIIGGNSEQADREWNGLIDEVCIFACALDANNVSALYSDGDPIAVANEAPTPHESTVNRVLSLDGREDCVRVADSQSLRSFSDAITIEVWLKASSFYAEDWAISSIIRKNVAEGAENFLLRFRNMNGSLCAQMGLGEVGTLGVPSEFDVNKWYHLAGTYDGRTITVLVNGLAIANQNASGRLRIDQSDLYIGKGDPEYLHEECFHGELDEIRIWNVARSHEQIQAAMNTPLTGKEAGLVAYWNFDDGTTKDLSGHGNDGVLSGDARIVEANRSASVVAQQGQPNKLVAWWKFENDANDSAGSNNGTIHGNPTYVDGKVGRAISLDGDDYVDCGNPDSLNFGTGDWTISAWIKTTQTGTNEDDAHMNRGTVFANGGDEVDGIRYTLCLNEVQLGMMTLTTDDNINNKVQTTGSTRVNDGAWHHVVGMRNAGQLRVYVDGALDGGSSLPDGYDLSGASQHNAYIGVVTDHRDSSLYKYFVGLIDEVCIIRGAIDADGVRALYSGENPVAVAKTAVITPPAVAGSQARPQRLAPAGVPGGIEGDWRIVSDQVSQNAIIKIRKNTDGNLAATIVTESPDETLPTIPLDEVTFENGTLRFKWMPNQGDFEGTMKEDGSIIEGQFSQQGKTMPLVLKRVVAAPSEAAPVMQEQLQERTSGTSSITTALILVLALACVVAGIVFFLVKSSIR